MRKNEILICEMQKKTVIKIALLQNSHSATLQRKFQHDSVSYISTYVGWLITMLGFRIIAIMIVLPGLAKRAA